MPAWLFVWANRALGLKWITYAHGANSVSRYSAVMTRGDLVVAPSRFLADFLLENYGEGRGKREEGRSEEPLVERLRVISPCVDLERFDPDNLDKAFAYRNKVFAKMEELRELGDSMEAQTSTDFWPYPSYTELLFGV